MRALTAVLVFALATGAVTQQGRGQSWTYKPLNYPGSTQTIISGMSGSNVLGMYKDTAGVNHGFVYNNDVASWKSLDFPGATETRTYDMSGNTIVGEYVSGGRMHGFTYDGMTWKTLDYPGSSSTNTACGISGSSIVGLYYPGTTGDQGYLYNGSTWKSLAYPGASTTCIYDISGDNIVGWYDSSSDFMSHGCVYNNANGTWRSVDYPGGLDTCVYGVFGNTVLGTYIDPAQNYAWKAFIYDGTTWTTLTRPGVLADCAIGMSGNIIVGTYYNTGYMLTIPEPATLSLLALGGLLIARRRRG